MSEPSAPLANREIWLIVGGLMIGMFLQGLDTLLIVTALPTIAGELGGLDRISWTLSAYLLTQTASVPLWGKLGDMWGRKRLYQFAIIGFAITSALCALAQNIDQLIAARALRGVAGGGLLVLPFAIVADIVPARSRARYQGAMGANIAVATLLGPLIGGFFVDNGSWRYAFLVGVPPAGLALLATRRLRLRARPISGREVDYVGAAMVVVIATGAMLAVTWAGRRFDWVSVPIIGLAASAVAITGVLVWWERRVTEPMVPLHMFSIRGVPMLMVAAFFSGIAMFAPWAVMPTFLQLVTGATATGAGLLLLPFIVTISIASFVGGNVIGRTGRCKAVVVTGMIVATTGFSLYLFLDAESTRLEAIGYMLVTGVGLGLVIQPMVVMAQGTVPHAHLGVATSMVSFFRQLGQAFGSGIALSVFAGQSTKYLRSTLGESRFDSLSDEVVGASPAAVAELDDPLRTTVVKGFADGLHDTFVAVIPFALIAVAILLLIPRVELTDDEELDELAPADDDLAADNLPAGGRNQDPAVVPPDVRFGPAP